MKQNTNTLQRRVNNNGEYDFLSISFKFLHKLDVEAMVVGFYGNSFGNQILRKVRKVIFTANFTKLSVLEINVRQRQVVEDKIRK